jgi:hypothetical protein
MHVGIFNTTKFRVRLKAQAIRIGVVHHLNVLTRHLALEYTLFKPQAFTLKACCSHQDGLGGGFHHLVMGR